MIRPDKLSNALSALNGILVLARAMAYEGRPGGEIAEVLDVAEYLPRLLADSEDQTDHFREVLVTLAGKNSMFQLAVDRFDQVGPQAW